MNGDKVFIDTNIFVYAKLLIESDAHKRRHAIEFLNNLEKDAVISTQVINEFSSVLLKHKVDGHIIRQSVEEIVNACFVAPVSLETVSGVWPIKEQYDFSYWDCLIISSALENMCSTLYTEDLQHGQIIVDALKIINPFL